ncbi:MAG: molybdopterin molybdotransferase MoeA [Anaerolineales bacterium]|nr:molybdopterin molybdotransferase MoeA [Anaerolineales bacterium]
MPEFLRLLPPSEALDRLLANLPTGQIPDQEILPTSKALDRVLAASVIAPHPLPAFPRSTVDGYAVRAADTFGAGASLPAYLTLAGEIRMGASASLTLQPGQAALVFTGGMLPERADAVVMLEDTQTAREGEIEVLKAAAVGQNALQVGEDVQAGETVLESGTRLRPQEIGGLMALGVVEVPVVRRPKVAILSTGDEVVPPEAEAGPGQVRDVNSYALSALVERAGGHPVRYGILPDRYEALLEAARRALVECQAVVITAGSSVSTRDLTAQVIEALGEPGVLVHGVAIKPGKPTILAVAGGVPIVGLPGNPVSALVVAGLFVVPVIHRLLGERRAAATSRVTARLSVNIPSEAGREDYLPVHLENSPEGLVAEPVYGRSNLIFTLVRADGLMRIPPEATGLAAGTPVEVALF